jgi:hypothetical protein
MWYGTCRKYGTPFTVTELVQGKMSRKPWFLPQNMGVSSIFSLQIFLGKTDLATMVGLTMKHIDIYFR